MTSKVHYNFTNRPAVRIDVLNAVSYYKNISPQLAKQFLFRIREAKIHIDRSPLGFPVKYSEVRTVLLKQFPYHIHYFINDSKKEIVILAIIHAYKKPADYTDR